MSFRVKGLLIVFELGHQFLARNHALRNPKRSALDPMRMPLNDDMLFHDQAEHIRIETLCNEAEFVRHEVFIDNEMP